MGIVAHTYNWGAEAGRALYFRVSLVYIASTSTGLHRDPISKQKAVGAPPAFDGLLKPAAPFLFPPTL